MNAFDPDLSERLRAADPLAGRPDADPCSDAASAVFERSLTARPGEEPVPIEQTARHRVRASRALPILAVAAAIVAVVGLALPRNAPAPLKRAVGSEPATASPDRPKLLRAADAVQASSTDPTGASRRAEEERFLDALGAYPATPTTTKVLAWLEANCEQVNTAAGTPTASTDCLLEAAPTVVNRAPAPVAADVLRALATLDGGLPTHAQRCPGWDAVDPAWRAEVEAAEAGHIWVRRNGALLVITTLTERDRTMPTGSADGAGSTASDGSSQIETDLADLRISASVSPASPESEVFVQCQPAGSAERIDQTVEGALGAYAEEHGDGCALSPRELEGLVAVDFAQACQVGGAPEGQDAPSTDAGADQATSTVVAPAGATPGG
jgi:hypothetical protein